MRSARRAKGSFLALRCRRCCLFLEQLSRLIIMNIWGMLRRMAFYKFHFVMSRKNCLKPPSKFAVIERNCRKSCCVPRPPASPRLFHVFGEKRSLMVRSLPRSFNKLELSTSIFGVVVVVRKAPKKVEWPRPISDRVRRSSERATTD